MAVKEVEGIKKFRKGMVLKATYKWPGEPTKTYFYRVTSVEYDGKGANVNIFKVIIDGKTEKYDQDKFLWDYETQIGRVINDKGWGRTILVSG